MGRKIRLTERELDRIVRKATMRAINEGKLDEGFWGNVWNGMKSAGQQVGQQMWNGAKNLATNIGNTAKQGYNAYRQGYDQSKIGEVVKYLNQLSQDQNMSDIAQVLQQAAQGLQKKIQSNDNNANNGWGQGSGADSIPESVRRRRRAF